MICTLRVKSQLTSQLTRDQKRDIQIATYYGLNTTQIIAILELTRQQVLYTLDTPPTPQHKKASRPPILNAEQWQHLVDFVCESKKNRRMNYQELAKEFWYWDIGYKAIKATLD